jgi:hypothetical protein
LGHVREYRLRRDQPDFEYDASGNLKPRQKYLSAPGRTNMLYVIPEIERSLLSDPDLTLVITEEEFKTLALWRLANYQASGRSRFLHFRAYTAGAAPSAKRPARTGRESTSRARVRTLTGLFGKVDALSLQRRSSSGQAPSALA